MEKITAGLIDKLEDELEESGVDDDLLDEIVHEIFASIGADKANLIEDPKAQAECIDAALQEASDFNNGGFRSQVSVILTECGVNEGVQMIREAIRDWKAENHADLNLS